MRFSDQVQVKAPLDKSGVCLFDGKFYNVVVLETVKLEAIKELMAKSSFSVEDVEKTLVISNEESQYLVKTLLINHMLTESDIERT